VITDAEIVEVLQGHCIVFGHRLLPRGHFRVDTKLLYPDGASISVFVERGNLLRNEGCALSDFGKTFAKLSELQVNPRHPRTRFQAIEETVGDVGARVLDDRIVIKFSELSEFSDCIINLGQACIRASCMIFNRRSAQQRSVAEEVQSIVESTGLPFELKHRFKGPFQNDVIVDYRVSNPLRRSSILTLGGSHVQANEVFRKWSDLKYSNVEDRLVTIFDERRGVERKEDLIRLEKVSEVLSIDNRRGIGMRLNAA